MLPKLKSSPSFERLSFERKVNDAIQSIERILDIERHPRLAGEVEHTMYETKYALVETTTNASLIAYMNVFEKMGLNSSVLQSIDKTQATTLRFDASINCKFEKEVIVDIPANVSFEEEHKSKSSGIFGNSETKRVSKILQHVTEFHYIVDTAWTLSIYSGTAVQKKRIIKERVSSTNLITQNKDSISDLSKSFPHQELSLTWLLQQIDTKRLTTQFKVDIEDRDTRTPVRNKATEKAIDFSNRLSKWSDSISSIITDSIAGYLSSKHNPALPNPINFSMERLYDIHREYPIFNPILPLLEENNNSDEPGSSSRSTCEIVEQSKETSITISYQNMDNDDFDTLLSSKDMTKLLNEHVRTVEVAIDTISNSFPNEQSTSVLSCSEVVIVLLARHMTTDLCKNYTDSMSYVESIIETQLISAIGKRVSSEDLDAFIRYHNGRILSPAPKPFSYAISRPNHYPVGLLSIERTESSKDECIYSHSRIVNTNQDCTFSIPLNAATTLTLDGDQILHGWLQHRFGPSHNRHDLVARARQFSSFILVIGTMIGPRTLEPRNAIIVQNKDEIFIPLIVSELPTAKEFKDAVKSLSPKQQQFARAFRTMQLSSSVFGMCVVQIKPQLECLLGLPSDSLDKEMKLTQDLMELFVDYQVPSDLLSYNGVHGNVANEDKVLNVKENVKSVMDVIDAEKERLLKAAQLKTEMAADCAFQSAFDETANSSGHTHPPVAYAAESISRRSARDSTRRLKANPMMNMTLVVSPVVGMDVAPPVAFVESTQNSTQSSNQPLQNIEGRHEVSVTSSANFQPERLDRTSVDFTLVPKKIDAAVEKSRDPTSLRSTVVKTSDNWVRNRQENILTSSKQHKLNPDEIKNEKNKAFDLLDALSRSGSLPIKYSELHVMVAVTHCFEKDVIDTVIQDNVDPIEKIEMSTLLFASAIHDCSARELIKDDEELRRLESSMPLLLQHEEDSIETTANA